GPLPGRAAVPEPRLVVDPRDAALVVPPLGRELEDDRATSRVAAGVRRGLSLGAPARQQQGQGADGDAEGGESKVCSVSLHGWILLWPPDAPPGPPVSGRVTQIRSGGRLLVREGLRPATRVDPRRPPGPPSRLDAGRRDSS